MPWWAWLITSIAAAIALLAWLAARFRARVRREFIAHLQSHTPGVEILSTHSTYLDLRLPNSDVSRVGLSSIYHAASLAGPAPADRLDIYESALQAWRQGLPLTAPRLSRDVDAPRLIPRLVTADFFDVPPERSRVPHVPLAQTGLYVVFILEGSDAAVYLTRDHLRELAMSESEVTATATANLRARFDLAPAVQAVLADPARLMSIKQADTHDAARVLLLPDLLAENQSLLAAIPDRDTLVFTQYPANNDLHPYTGLLATLSEKLLMPHLLRIDPTGITLAAPPR